MGGPINGPNITTPPTYQYSGGYNPFSYLFCDLRSGAIKGQMTMSGVSFGKTLNGIGQFQGTIDLEDPNTQLVDPLDLTTPSNTALFVDYNGAIVWGGIILARQRNMQPQSRKLTITASDLWTYFSQRVQATDYSAPPYSGITGPSQVMPIWDASATDAESVYDPLLIAWQIVSDALTIQSFYGNILGGLGVAANTYTSASAYLASGTETPLSNYINITYPYASLQLVNSIVTQLTQLGLDVGPDTGVDCAYSSGRFSVPIATLNFSYPRRGRTFAQNNLFVDLSSARSYQFPEDGSQTANVVYEMGSNSAIAVSENLSPIDQGYPIFEVVKSRSQITSANALGILSEIGVSDLALLSYPAVVPQFTVDLFNSSLMLGTFIEGDDVLVYIPGATYDGLGGIFDPGFPNGLQQEWRIVQWQATVADTGDSTLAVTLNQPPTFTATGPPLSQEPI